MEHNETGGFVTEFMVHLLHPGHSCQLCHSLHHPAVLCPTAAQLGVEKDGHSVQRA
jgi:hypothetical protein